MIKKSWYALRSLFFYVFMALYTAPWFLVMFCLGIFGHKAMYKMNYYWSRICQVAARVICGIKFKVEGFDNIPQEPVLYFVKHQSAWETVTLPGILPFHVYVLKKELLNIPFFGWGLRISRNIPIDRSQNLKALKQVIAIGKKRLAAGASIVIFPEGTRVPVGEHPKFHKSGVMLAKNTGSRIVPITHNAGLIWPKSSWIKRPGTITLKIGKPIDTQDANLNHLNDEVYQWLKTNTEALCQ